MKIDSVLMRDEPRMPRSAALLCLLLQPFEPAHFGFELFDHKRDHPDGFMKIVADLDANRFERRPFASQLSLQKLLPPLNLSRKNSGSRKSTRLNSSHVEISY